MEQDALAVSRGFSKNPIYTESCRCYETYRFYRFTDLRICTTFAAPGPTRARARSTTRSVAARRERCIKSFPRAHAREVAGRQACGESGRRACETGCGGAAGRSCWGPGPSQLRGSSGVLPVGWSSAGLRSCWEAGPRARAHAESIDLMTKSAYFRRQSGCTARIRKAWRWRGSAGSSTYSDAGLAVARERGITSS